MDVRTGTAAQLWQSSLVHVQQRLHLRLSENQESYLVFLLIRHARDVALGGRTMALELLQALEAPGGVGDDRLRDVGDRCLLLAGLFPGLRHRRHVDAVYYQHLGRTAYGLLGERGQGGLARLYAELACAYGDLVRVLLGLRGETGAAAGAASVTLRDMAVLGNA